MTQSEGPSAKPDAGKPKSEFVGADGQPIKRAPMANFFLALKHINQASESDSVRQRLSDSVTIGLVIVCILCLLAAISFPSLPLGGRLMPLLLTVAMVLAYIINRLGIIVSLTPRQALIVWQILVAGFWLGVTSSMLVMLLVLFIISRPS